MNDNKNSNVLNGIALVFAIIPFTEILSLICLAIGARNVEHGKVSRTRVYASVICIVKFIIIGLFFCGIKLINEYAPDEFYCSLIEPSKCEIVNGEYICDYKNSFGYKRTVNCGANFEEEYSDNIEEFESNYPTIIKDLFINDELFNIYVEIYNQDYMCDNDNYLFNIYVGKDKITSVYVGISEESSIDLYYNDGFITSDNEYIVFNMSDAYIVSEDNNTCITADPSESGKIKYNVKNQDITYEKNV